MIARLISTVLVIVLATTSAWSQAPTKKRDRGRRSLEGSRAVTFKTAGDIALKLHVFEPKAHRSSDRRPAIVFFFGGGWRGGSTGQFAPHCRYLAGRGMVANAAEYRVHGRHRAQVADCVADAKSAIRWGRGHAGKLGVDPQRIAAGDVPIGRRRHPCVATVVNTTGRNYHQTGASQP